MIQLSDILMVRLFFILTITLLHSCKAQKEINKDIMIPEISNEFETFDIEAFEKHVDAISGKRIQITNEYYSEEEGQSPGYIRRTFFHDSYFGLNKKFFENGNIKEKAILFNNGYPVGIHYIFDEAGNLIDEINTEKGFDYSYLKIVEYCEKNEITLTKGHVTSGFQTRVLKVEDENNEKTWQIIHQSGPEELTRIVLDGKTGEEIEREQLEFINH